MKVTRGLLALLALATGMTAYPAERPFIPVDPSRRLQFEGLSILPPQGENWYMGSPEVRNKYGPDVIVAFLRLTRPPSITHTVIALVRAERVPLVKDRVEKLQEIARATFAQTERERPLSLNISPDSSLASECVRYDAVLEDRGVPLFRGSVFVTERRGYICIHPEMPEVAIEIYYTQRRLQEETPLPLEADGEPFLKSLVFGKLPPLAIAQPAQEKPAQEKTWKGLPVYTPNKYEEVKGGLLTYGSDAPVRILEQYYLPRLEKSGWVITRRVATEKSAKYGAPALLLNVKGEKRTATISMFFIPEAQLTLVAMVCAGEDGRSPCSDN